jgi:hypothetical protein
MGRVGVALEAEHMGVNDIVTRLRQWAIATDAVPASDLMDEAAAEIERLRSQPCPYVTGTVTRYCTLTPFTLTDAERAAIAEAMRQVVESDCIATPHALEVIDTLRGLLERTRNGSPDGCETGK